MSRSQLQDAACYPDGTSRQARPSSGRIARRVGAPTNVPAEPNTTPEGALKVEPESRGCNAWAAVPGGAAARDRDPSPAMMSLPMDAGPENPATLRDPACIRPVLGLANKVEVLGPAARRRGLSAEFFGWAAREGMDTNPAQPAQGVGRRKLHRGNRGVRTPGSRRQHNGVTGGESGRTNHGITFLSAISATSLATSLATSADTARRE